jgi:hypothetical protein
MIMRNQRSGASLLIAVVALTTILSCRDKGPRVTIAYPPQSSHFVQGDTVDFSADLNGEMNFGVIPSGAWRWISDVDGELGRDSIISTPNLSVAEHQITASVRHRLGLSRARVVVFVDSITARGSTR